MRVVCLIEYVVPTIVLDRVRYAVAVIHTEGKKLLPIVVRVEEWTRVKSIWTMPLVAASKKFFRTVYNHSNCLLKCYIITWLYHKSTVKSQNQPHSCGWQARSNRVKHKGPAASGCGLLYIRYVYRFNSSYSSLTTSRGSTTSLCAHTSTRTWVMEYNSIWLTTSSIV